MDQFLVTRVIYKNRVILITIKNSYRYRNDSYFFIVSTFSLVKTAFLPTILNLKNVKNFKKVK